jgi:hypothetical protein
MLSEKAGSKNPTDVPSLFCPIGYTGCSNCIVSFTILTRTAKEEGPTRLNLDPVLKKKASKNLEKYKNGDNTLF